MFRRPSTTHRRIDRRSFYFFLALVARLSCEARSDEKRGDRLPSPIPLSSPPRSWLIATVVLSIETRLHKVRRRSPPPGLWDARGGARRAGLNRPCVSSPTSPPLSWSRPPRGQSGSRLRRLLYAALLWRPNHRQPVAGGQRCIRDGQAAFLPVGGHFGRRAC